MLSSFKKLFYFPIAAYFRFFARIRLRKWNPRIIVVTGSNGKTTLLHMLEAQFGDKAKVSHHANSAFGVPFDILDLHRKTFQTSEWINLFLNAVQAIFKPTPKQKFYIVEADADRPNEGKFLAELLRPDIVLWISTGRTHSMNFDVLVSSGKFKTVEEAIAYEYGYFLEHCKELAVIDGDSTLESNQVSRTKAKVKAITEKEYLGSYTVGNSSTTFTIKGKKSEFAALLPKELYLSLAMSQEAVGHVGEPFDASFKNFQIPPGRGSIFSGIKNTVLIDSTYNGNLGSIKAMLAMFAAFPVKKKWVVIGDMKELGNEEKEEHEALADLLNAMDLEQVILVGKIVRKYTEPKMKIKTKGFDKASDAREFLQNNIKGGEAILFKGSQSIYLEGLVEILLVNKEDQTKLPRQDAFWQNKRKELGF